jgi:choline dehydrogenase-like flavoprotein
MGGGCESFPGYYKQIEGFGVEFKRNIKRYYPTPIGGLIQAPTLPSDSNYIDIDPNKQDIFGIPQLRFHFQWGRNELLMWEHCKNTMLDLFKAMGAEIWGADDEPNRPGTSLHETGVCRMGNDPKRYVTNKWAQAHDIPNLYIADASIFPSPTDKTTTMPIIAFTMRTCDYMLGNFKGGVHKRA